MYIKGEREREKISFVVRIILIVLRREEDEYILFRNKVRERSIDFCCINRGYGNNLTGLSRDYIPLDYLVLVVYLFHSLFKIP